MEETSWKDYKLLVLHEMERASECCEKCEERSAEMSKELGRVKIIAISGACLAGAGSLAKVILEVFA